MPDIFGELARDWDSAEHAIAGWFGHGTQATAAVTATVETTATEGDPVSLADDLHNLATRLENLGEEAVTKAEQLGTEGITKAQAILASPAAAEGFTLLHTLTGINVDPAIVTQALGGLRAIVQAYAPAQAGQAAAAQPPAEQAPAAA